MSLDDFSQIPFTEFAENPEPRCPVLLLLDTSASMCGDKIEQLNAGLAAFQEDLAQDSLALARCEIAIVTFGPVREVMDFTSAQYFIPPHLNIGTRTPLGSAILHGLKLLERRREEIRHGGINLYLPWVFLITDGAPTDDWAVAAEKIKRGEDERSFTFFSVGVEGADMNMLSQLSHRGPRHLVGLKFRELFLWLSESLKFVSRSQADDASPMTLPKYDSWSEL